MSILGPHLEMVPVDPPVFREIPKCHPCLLRMPKRVAQAVVRLPVFNVQICHECALDLQNDLIAAAERLMDLTLK